MRILVCDDDAVIRYLLNVVLGKRNGDEVIDVSAAGDVVSMARETNPDLIVLDYLMPGRTGADLVRDLAAEKDLASIPVVFLTGRSDIETEELRELGVAGLIEKPFDTSTLADRLRAMAGVSV